MAKKGGEGVLNGFLDEGSHFKGELTFEDTLRIDGKFEGTIRSKHACQAFTMSCKTNFILTKFTATR